MECDCSPLAVECCQHHVCGIEGVHKVRRDCVLLLHDIRRVADVTVVHQLYLLQTGLHLPWTLKCKPCPHHKRCRLHTPTYLHCGPLVIRLNNGEPQWCHPLHWLACTTYLPGTLCEPVLSSTDVLIRDSDNTFASF